MAELLEQTQVHTVSVLTVVLVVEMHFILLQVLEYQVKDMMVEIALQVAVHQLMVDGMAVVVAEQELLVLVEVRMAVELVAQVYNHQLMELLHITLVVAVELYGKIQLSQAVLVVLV